MPDVIVYCPRCDRPFSAKLKRDAILKMEAHVKKAHPDYYENLKE